MGGSRDYFLSDQEGEIRGRFHEKMAYIAESLGIADGYRRIRPRSTKFMWSLLVGGESASVSPSPSSCTKVV